MSSTVVKSFPDFIFNADSEDKMKECASKLIQEIKTEWKDTSLHKHVVFNDGLTNKLVGVYVQEKSEMILFRIYGVGTDLIIDRDAERRNMKILHENGLGKPLYAVFSNGIAYGFADGKIVETDDLTNPDIFGEIAKNMSQMHKIPLNKNTTGDSPVLFEKIYKFLDVSPDGFTHKPSLNERYLKECFKKDELKKEIQELERSIKEASVSTNKTVLCHNDLLLGNIVYNHKNPDNKISFIDFEYMCSNYALFDIANHFCEFVGVVDEVLNYDKHYPSEEYQKNWLKIYLKAFNDDLGEPISEEDVHATYTLVQKFALCAHLFWGIWALIQADMSKIDFDFLGYALQRFNEYKRKKSIFLNHS